MRKEIKWFAGLMEKELQEIDELEIPWNHKSMAYLFSVLIEEAAELSYVLFKKGSKDKENKNAVILECVDVANFAMMIAKNCKNASDGD